MKIGNKAIDRFIKLAYMTLRSTVKFPLSRLEQSYKAMRPFMHPKADEAEFDSDAFLYASARLPSCIFKAQHVVLGQSITYFEEVGISVSKWEEVYAKARRRRYLYDGKDTVAAFISSKSDIDDVIPTLLCFQIEWNKLAKNIRLLSSDGLSSDYESLLIKATGTDSSYVRSVFSNLEDSVKSLYSFDCNFSIQNFEASYSRYMKETSSWWDQICSAFPDIEDREVYFVSSNTHSLINIISGFAEKHEREILETASEIEDLGELVRKYNDSSSSLYKSNLLYYLLMKCESCDDGALRDKRIAYEESLGIKRIRSSRFLDVPTQIIDFGTVSKTRMADRIGDSNAIILNIDYPLGRTAYFVLSKVSEHIDKLRGVYVIGKAASVFAERGDVLIPSSVVDLHNGNNYYFSNAIGASDLEKYISQKNHSIYDKQRAVTVLGTFLQNKKLLNDILAAGITDIEMEFGPYLAAFYEIVYPKRYPEEEIITIPSDSIDLGIAHYVSDNPFSSSPGLSHALALDGVEATYAVSYAVLDKILSDISKRRRSLDGTN